MSDFYLQTKSWVPSGPFQDTLSTPLEISLPPQTIMAITGPQYGGKTTLCKTLCGLMSPKRGQTIFADDLPIYRQIIYLSAESRLISSLSVIDNVLLPALYHQIAPRRALKEEALRLIHQLEPGLRPEILAPYLKAETQRKLVIIRALLLRPKVLCLDEAFRGLHHYTIENIEDFLTDHIKQHHMSMVIGTLHMPFVQKNADCVVYTSEKDARIFHSSDDFFSCEDTDIQEFLNRFTRMQHV